MRVTPSSIIYYCPKSSIVDETLSIYKRVAKKGSNKKTVESDVIFELLEKKEYTLLEK